MHTWPSITPWNIDTLPAHWWRYLVTCAIKDREAAKDAADRRTPTRRGRGARSGDR